MMQTEVNGSRWVLWGLQETFKVDSDDDLEKLILRSGRTSWTVWFNVGGKPGLAFISSELVNGKGIQYTIRKSSS